MNPGSNKTAEVLQFLCETFKDRAEAQGFKGKKRDDLCFEFFMGATAAFKTVDIQIANQLLAWIQLILAPRGYRAVEEEI